MAGLQPRAEQLAATLPPLLVAAERVAATVAQGVHGRRRVGQGDSFWQFRAYESGDSPQRIDWRESARSQRLYVRETEWEAAQSIYLWRDASASMDYASAPGVPHKRSRAELVLLALSALLVRAGERVSLLGSGVPPLAGRVALHRLAMQIDAESRNSAGTGGDSLPRFDMLPRHAQLVLIGDFLSPLEKVQQRLAQFAALGIRGHLLQVMDPAEETLPFAGRIRFEGMEDEPHLMISRVETVRTDYAERLAAHRDGLVAILRPMDWSFAIHRTDRPPQMALLALYAAMSPIAIRAGH